jgi:hypothetical protein
MNRILLSILLSGAPIVVSAADDLKVSQLEQDVRVLQRQLNAQAQQLDEMRRQLSLAGAQGSPSASVTPPALKPPDNLWLDAARWKQVKVGMSELEVINLLGPPASMRGADEERLLLYAMEVGASGFLAGSVALRDRAVVTVKPPVLQ